MVKKAVPKMGPKAHSPSLTSFNLPYLLSATQELLFHYQSKVLEAQQFVSTSDHQDASEKFVTNRA